MVSTCNTTSTEPASPEISSAMFTHLSNKFEIVDGTIPMPPPPTPVFNHICSLTHDDDNVSPVLEWDDAFEGSLLSIELSPLVRLSLEEFMEVPTLPSTLALCIKRDVNDWACHTPTMVCISLSLPHTHTKSPHIERLHRPTGSHSLIVHGRFPLFDDSFHMTKAMSLEILFITLDFPLQTMSPWHQPLVFHFSITFSITHRRFPPFNSWLHLAKGLLFQVLFIPPDFPLRVASSQQAFIFHSTTYPQMQSWFCAWGWHLVELGEIYPTGKWDLLPEAMGSLETGNHLMATCQFWQVPRVTSAALKLVFRWRYKNSMKSLKQSVIGSCPSAILNDFFFATLATTINPLRHSSHAFQPPYMGVASGLPRSHTLRY